MPEGTPRIGRPRIEHDWSTGVARKRCCTCKDWLPLDTFAKDSSRWDGLQSACRSCGTAATTRYRKRNLAAYYQYSREYSKVNCERKTAQRMTWRANNVERDKENRRAYNERNREKIRERDRARWPRERERRIAYSAAYYAANKDRLKAQVAENYRRWKAANPELAAEKGIRDRAKRRARERHLPVDSWTSEQVIERDGLTCWMCQSVLEVPEPGIRRRWDFEHLIPIAREYSNHPGDTFPNIAIACNTCNKMKGPKLLPAAIARYEENLKVCTARASMCVHIAEPSTPC